MHKINIPQSIVERVIRHRGKEHVCEDLDPEWRDRSAPPGVSPP